MNHATPSWCFWACAITAALGWLFYRLCDVRPIKIFSEPLVRAGQNVLLAYLLSELLPNLLEALHWSEGSDRLAANLP